MRLFYSDNINPNLKKCIIDGAEAKHIYKVLRMSTGDTIILMDKEGRRYEAVIDNISQGKVEVLIKEVFPHPKPSPVKIILYISLIRSGPMDLVIQKSSELGVDTIQPFYSERSIIRIPEERIKARLRHWNEVAKNTAKQCGRSVPARVLKPISLNEVLKQARKSDSLKILLWEQEKAQSIKTILRQTNKRVNQVTGIIGPEGGFSKKEAERFKKEGFLSVSLGKRILRAETAAIIFVAIVQYELGDLGLFDKP